MWSCFSVYWFCETTHLSGGRDAENPWYNCVFRLSMHADMIASQDAFACNCALGMAADLFAMMFIGMQDRRRMRRN